MSVEQYRAMERAGVEPKHEYFDGAISLMAGGTRRHNTLAGNAFSLLAGAVAGLPCRACNSAMRVRLSEAVQVYPDVGVTCDERDAENAEDDEIAYPRLVVEVLSPSTERVDRGRQLRNYQSCASVEEYMLVNADYQAVEIYRRERRAWTYHRHEAGEEVDVVYIGARLPIELFYARTSVPAEPSPPAGSTGAATPPNR